MTRYWYDSEFIDSGRTIDLISIGIVSSDGREYYAQSAEFHPKRASEWVWRNVLNHLEICPHVSAYGPIENHLPNELKTHKKGQCIDQQRGFLHDCPWRSRDAMCREVLSFMDIEAYGKPELWGYYSAYDHVVFCQLFGTMMDLPNGFPMLTYDLRQWLDMNGMQDVRQPDDSIHNALEDARWIKETWEREVKRV